MYVTTTGTSRASNLYRKHCHNKQHVPPASGKQVELILLVPLDLWVVFKLIVRAYLLFNSTGGHGKKAGSKCVPSNHRRLYDAGALGLHSALGSLGSAASFALCAALALHSASAFTWTNSSLAEID